MTIRECADLLAHLAAQHDDRTTVRVYSSDGAPLELTGAVVREAETVVLCSRVPVAPAYVCPRCGAESHNPHDIRARYCGRCHQFETL